MDKIKKVLRSRFFLAAVVILVQFVILTSIFIWVSDILLPFRIFAWAFYIVTMIYVLNRDEIPEMKLPWIVIMMLLPVIGAFVFFLLSTNKASKKDYLRFEKSAKRIAPHLRQTNNIDKLKELDFDAYSQARFLHIASKMPVFDKSKVTYYPLGESFFQALLEELRSAKQYIFMEYFIVEEGVMWDSIHKVLKEKVKQGVDVYVMYDDLGCITTLPDNYYEKLTQEGINSL